MFVAAEEFESREPVVYNLPSRFGRAHLAQERGLAEARNIKKAAG
jgi:hypothetical protein